MALEDKVCTLVPYFTMREGRMEAFKALGEQMLERTRGEGGAVFYGFSFAGDTPIAARATRMPGASSRTWRTSTGC